MRHHNTNRKFGRQTDQRRALMKSLASNLITHEKMSTTEAKAKEIRPYMEKLVSRGREGTVAAKRLLMNKLASKKNVSKLVKEISPRYKDRKGGYTRIIKTGTRGGDGSKMAIIEFV